MYDVIIIGAGPAGISASLYAKRANLKVLVIYHGESNLEQAEKIENYYGFPGGITGKELTNRGIQQAEELGVHFVNEEAIKISIVENNYFCVKTVEKDYTGKTMILSTGNKKVKPKINGIDKFEGKGISYCAICDAFFYRNKDVAVIGDGKFAVNEARELANVANKVTILTDGNSKIECEFEVNESKIKRISGEKRVNCIEFEDGSTLKIDGIFIALGEAGAVDFAKTMGIMLEGDNIRVNEKMETNIPGVYACGNVTGGLLQVCKAVYEGAEAGLSAVNYIRNLE